MKKIIYIASALIVLIVIGLFFLGSNLGPIIKSAVETYGPPITKTEVKLDSVNVSIFSGAAGLDGFLLGNPKGFSMPTAVECDSIRVKVDTNSLTSDKIIIEEVYVDGPVISYEQKGKTNNFQTILNNINKTIAGEKKDAKTKKSGESESEKTIQINDFIVKNGKINLGGSLLDAFGDGGMGIELPDIHLKDIGKDKEATPAEAFGIILKEMTGDVTGTVTNVGKQLGETLGKAVEGATEGAGDVGKSVGGAIKGLFGD